MPEPIEKGDLQLALKHSVETYRDMFKNMGWQVRVHRITKKGKTLRLIPPEQEDETTYSNIREGMVVLSADRQGNIQEVAWMDEDGIHRSSVPPGWENLP